MAVTVVAEDITYVVTKRGEMFRRDSAGNTQYHTMPHEIFCLFQEASSGKVYGAGRASFSGPFQLFELTNPQAGAPNWVPLGNLGYNYGTITDINGTIYGLQDGNLLTIDLSDPTNPVETLLGQTGVTNTGASGYDPVTDTLYAISNDDDNLYIVDRQNVTSTSVGYMGHDTVASGGEWYDDQFFIVTQNAFNNDTELGTVDLTTGAFTELFSVDPGAPSNGTSLLIIPGLIPEPGTIAMLSVALLFVGRRR
jgi:hypothetical protein